MRAIPVAVETLEAPKWRRSVARRLARGTHQSQPRTYQPGAVSHPDDWNPPVSQQGKTLLYHGVRGVELHQVGEPFGEQPFEHDAGASFVFLPTPHGQPPAARVLPPEIWQIQAVDTHIPVILRSYVVGGLVGPFRAQDSDFMAAFGQKAADITHIERSTPAVIGRVHLGDVPDSKLSSSANHRLTNRYVPERRNSASLLNPQHKSMSWRICRIRCA